MSWKSRTIKVRRIILLIACLKLSIVISDHLDVSSPQVLCSPLTSSDETNLIVGETDTLSSSDSSSIINNNNNATDQQSFSSTDINKIGTIANYSNSDINDLSLDSKPNDQRKPQDFSPTRKAFSTVNTMLDHIILVCGIIANAAVLLVVFKRGKIHPISDIFIANLGIADMLQLVGLIFVLMTEANDNRWEYGYSGCMVSSIQI